MATEFTARTHPAPNYMVDSRVDGKATNLAGFKVLMDKMLEENAKAMEWSSAPGYATNLFAPTRARAHAHAHVCTGM